MQVNSVHKSTFFFESSGTGKYRYGFNGMEKDDNLKGTGNSYDFGARIYDSRLGRWLAVDPSHDMYPDISTCATQIRFKKC